MQVEPEHQQELNPEDEEEFHIEDFMFPDLMRPGLGHICEYCNISKGKSMIFSSMDQYADHWYENHQGYSLYAFDKDLDKFFRQFQQDYKKRLREWQKAHLQYGITWLAWK